MGETESGASAGLISAVKSIAATLLASGKARLELLSNEIETGKLRIIELLLIVLVTAFCLGVGVILTVILLAALFWEQRLAVLTVCALAFLALGGVFLVRLIREIHRPERVFSASVTELEQDLRQLSSHEPPAR